eukprot:7786404-Pyramimonas_sp.AAC.1
MQNNTMCTNYVGLSPPQKTLPFSMSLLDVGSFAYATQPTLWGGSNRPLRGLSGEPVGLL